MNRAAQLLDGPAWAIAAAVRAREVTVGALVEASLARIGATDPALNAFADVCTERARQRAGELDLELLDRKGAAALLPLVGVPVAASDGIDVAGVVNRAGAAIEDERAPARRDAPVVARLEEAGAVLVGTTSVDAFLAAGTGETSCDGAARNPRELARMPGGACGGAAAAVASGQLSLALGLDARGGVRVPASLCGTFGLKPTYGRVPRSGTWPYAPTLDHVGVLARHAADLAFAHDALQGHDARDPACAARPPEPCAGAIHARIDTLRIAVLGDAFETLAAADARAAVTEVAQALGTRRTVVLPGTDRANAAATLVAMAESAVLHLARVRERASACPARLRDPVLAGAMLPAAWLQQAQRLRRWYGLRVAELLRELDVLVAPATPCSAPPHGTESLALAGRELPVDAALGVLAQPFSFIGLPVVVVPIWPPGASLPVGVQLVGAPWREDVLLRVAQHLQAGGIARAPPAPVSEPALRAAQRTSAGS